MFNISTCLAVLVLAVSTSAYAQEVLVFTDRNNPVQPVPWTARLIELDQVRHLENVLSADLPTNPAQATTAAKVFVQTDLNSFHKQLAQAYQGIVDGWTLGVKKIPAVVVDRKYVIYGETDVGEALFRIQSYRKASP